MHATEAASPLTHQIRDAFVGLQQQLRADMDKIHEPELKVLFEESAEVLGALAETFDDYDRKS